MADVVETIIDDFGTFSGNAQRTLSLPLAKGNIDGKVQGNTTLGRVPAGRRFYPTAVAVEVQSLSGFGAPPTVSMGTNSPNFDNIQPATALAGFNQQFLFNRLELTQTRLSIASGLDVVVRVSVAANATTYILRVAAEGYYL